MDNLLWIAMSGAKENFHSLAVRSNNLANASTTGFKADFENSRDRKSTRLTSSHITRSRMPSSA